MVCFAQRWYRGRYAAALARGRERSDFDRKLSDVCRLKKVMAASGVPFAVPAEVACGMIAQLVHFHTPVLAGEVRSLEAV